MTGRTRLAVVSGGGTGIGLAIAESLVRAGDDVVLVGRRPEVLERAVGQLTAHEGAASCLVADLSDPDGAGRVRSALAERGRPIDVVVANAGQPAPRTGDGLTELALHGWVLTLANRLGPDGITANVVAPGFTDGTELVAGRIPPDRRTTLLARVAAGRPAEPAEIAAVVQLVADPRSSYLNGQVICADGGVRAT